MFLLAGIPVNLLFESAVIFAQLLRASKCTLRFKRLLPKVLWHILFADGFAARVKGGLLRPVKAQAASGVLACSIKSPGLLSEALYSRSGPISAFRV